MANTGHIEAFLLAQTDHWNTGDKQAFLDDYRRAAPDGLTIEYVGRPPQDGWVVLDHMWDQQRDKIRVEPVAKIVNGNEAACYVRNVIIGTGRAIETIELYRFDAGQLYVRYFVKQ
ncbi:nuclear transport factor 2 family protein [Paraburkholderia dinghuensis]|uniref:Nuclear transport factor 2 family protein n=1 Tax=Paraburkholderia dinghuensis TaxID=2305225 RepID=A0A3N6N2Z1_9BURK|nr:nuclear transport factor 2 family protein [Paraburkholderia dinghuensis]RQH04951.1 nuclear transport factor 2 family protein [Paraburkholderia dinghuensis]